MRFAPRGWRRLARLVPLLAAVGALGCQSSDVVGGRNQVPPPPEDTGWRFDFEPCATDRVQASRIRTNLFLAVDTSCSMDQRVEPGVAGSPTKWEAASSAFNGFFTDPTASTLDLALRLWPASDGCDHQQCDADACADPQVPLGSLGDATHQQALTDALSATSPGGFTPMHAALDGATRWAATHLSDAPDEQVAIIFVTDGEPRGCDEDIGNIAALAASSASLGVPVYAVGIEGVNTDQIDQIAAAGSTGSGFFVGNADAEVDLLAALKAIQEQVVSCSFSFPTDATADPLSPDLVRVEVEVDGEIERVRRILDASRCEPDGGWYLDDPESPSVIALCPSTCAEVQDIDEVAIELAVGCACLTDDDCAGDQVCTSDGCVPPCVGPDCVDTSIPPDAVRGRQAVQGGALNCAATPASGSLLLLLAGALVIGARARREAP